MLDLPASFAAQTATSALQYLPVPVLVLSPLKTVILANEAMGKLLCMANSTVKPTGDCGCGPSVGWQEIYGQTLSQVGVDLVQKGVPIWVNWEHFLDTLGENSERHTDSGETTPTLRSDTDTPTSSSTVKLDRTTVHDVAVDVVLSPERCVYPSKSNKGNRIGSSVGTSATMIISAWWSNGAKYYTLTFTSSVPVPAAAAPKPTSRSVANVNRSIDSPSSVSSSASSGTGKHSLSQSGSSPSSSLSSPSAFIPSFPPNAPAAKSSLSSSASILQKATRLRDAILNTMTLPCYAMWKDQTVGIPNEALMKLCAHDTGTNAGEDFVSRFIVWDEQFTRQLDYEEYPIVQLLRTEEASTGRRFGLKNPKNGDPRVFDADCEPLRDTETGEFLGGIVILKDVTDYVDRLESYRNENQTQFEFISNHIPPMVWTTTPEGALDWFSARWYEYTGMSREESLGFGWTAPFHPDDMPATSERWKHSLATGDEYVTEYRCRRRDGVWRWFLGGARPMRDERGKIVRWFGTCTDIHDAVEARESAQRTREQLTQIIETAKLTLCSVDLSGVITMIEGTTRWKDDDDSRDAQDFVGTCIFDDKDMMLTEERLREYKRPLTRILEGASSDETCEFVAPNGRSFRHRYRPLVRQIRDGGVAGDMVLDGAIIVSTDISGIRKREDELKTQEKENARLAANELAAKEASRLKSSFLANMSHEIRTPIAGVIGMSELLADMNLTQEQAECAENILRSANGLLTVINDILDFSKIESGHLDVEEVQFSLSVVLHDVNKMLSFAAVRKNLTYNTLIDPSVSNDLRVLGDPGRLRQILTNILTNSIKFTSEGTVSLAANVRKETSDTAEVEFTIEDTGIGIEEEVRKKLFTPFAQADSSTARRFGGTGLGLTISKNLVDLMQGSISLESNLGVGTKCVFSIPFKKGEYLSNGSPLVNLGAIPDRLQSDMSISMSSDDRNWLPLDSPVIPHNSRQGSLSGLLTSNVSANPQQMVRERDQQPQSEVGLTEEDRKTTHVLVVEDNAVNQQIALKTVRKLGFSVNAVWNGQEAIDYVFGEHTPDRPKPDIILMDVQMPILDGYKATQKIRRQKETPKLTSVPIVAMTASAIQGDKEKCMKAGMDDYLAKVS